MTFKPVNPAKPVNPIILGRKNCLRCGRWLLVTEFRCRGREPLRLNPYCGRCETLRKREWKLTHLERHRAVQRRYAAKRREEGSERYAAIQARYRARLRVDPVRMERVREGRRRSYARGRIKRRFMARLLAVLYLELERREEKAREWRAYKRRLQSAYVARRREAMLRGELPSEPEFVNGELRRLPVLPLVRWMKGQKIETLAEAVGVSPRMLSRYQTGESVMVPLEVVDVIAVRTGVMLMDIYPPDEFPSIYEAPEE